MTDKQIAMIIILILAVNVAIIFIIANAVAKTKSIITKNKRLLPEQKDIVKLLEINKLEIPSIYYSKSYDYEILVENIRTFEKIRLVTTSYEINILDIGDEYTIIHDGIVLFEIHKSLLSL